jgi:hypothetical protein
MTPPKKAKRNTRTLVKWLNENEVICEECRKNPAVEYRKRRCVCRDCLCPDYGWDYLDADHQLIKTNWGQITGFAIPVANY